MLDFPKHIEAWFGQLRWLHLLAGLAMLLAPLMSLEYYVRTKKPFKHAQPYYMTGKNFAPRWVYRGNPRAFTEVANTKTDPKPFTIAWVGGSDMIVSKADPDCHVKVQKHFYTLPSLAATQIESVGRQDVQVFGFYQNGAGIGDMRRAALYALESNPKTDMLIWSLNPVSTLNDYIIYGPQSKQRASVFTLPNARPFDFALTIPAVRPSEFAMQFLSHYSAAIDQRGLQPNLTKILLKTQHFPVSEKKTVSKSRPTPRDLISHDVKTRRTTDEERGFWLLFMGNLEENATGGRILRETLIDIRESGIPTLLYIPPIRDVWDDNEAIMARMRAFQARIEEIIEEVDADNIDTDLESWTLRTETIRFRDNIHLTCGQDLAERIMTNIGKAAGQDVVLKPRTEVYLPAPLKFEVNTGGQTSPANDLNPTEVGTKSATVTPAMQKSNLVRLFSEPFPGLISGLTSGKSFTVYLDMCAAADAGWEGQAIDPLGRLKCGTPYILSFDSNTSEWSASGIDEYLEFVGKPAQYTHRRNGPMPTNSSIYFWGSKMQAVKDGRVFTREGEHVGHIFAGVPDTSEENGSFQ